MYEMFFVLIVCFLFWSFYFSIDVWGHVRSDSKFILFCELSVFFRWRWVFIICALFNYKSPFVWLSFHRVYCGVRIMAKNLTSTITSTKFPGVKMFHFPNDPTTSETRISNSGHYNVSITKLSYFLNSN